MATGVEGHDDADDDDAEVDSIISIIIIRSMMNKHVGIIMSSIIISHKGKLRQELTTA